MSRGYKTVRQFNSATIVSGSVITIGPIDVREYDKFLLHFHNDHSTTNLVINSVQGSHNPIGTSTNSATRWVTIPTASLDYPSSVAASSTDGTSLYDNAYGWLRVLATGSGTGAAPGAIELSFGGFVRY